MSTTVDILMYHSVSDQGGATSIPLPVFQAQMQAITTAGIKVISLDDFLAAQRGVLSLPERSVILTFDDGYLDFLQDAWPVIRAQGWPVIVYLPTQFIGDREIWQGHATPPRPLMSWEQIKKLAEQGVTFGAHSHSHPDLSTLEPQDLLSELTISRDEIEHHTGLAPAHFAPPYGYGNAAVQTAIKSLYKTSCGTRLASARPTDDAFDLPRIEMFYFQNTTRWRQHLAGLGAPYLAIRKTLRAVRTGLIPSRSTG